MHTTLSRKADWSQKLDQLIEFGHNCSPVLNTAREQAKNLVITVVQYNSIIVLSIEAFWNFIQKKGLVCNGVELLGYCYAEVMVH